MKISFLVTYYNQEKYVRNSLDSILSIDMPDEWEILVGDDGSTDNTIEIVNEYINADPEHIRLIRMPREEGRKYFSVARASENRLTLMENSTGDYFCTLDGDDFYTDKNFVKDAIAILEKDESIAVVTFGYKEYYANKPEKELLLPQKSDGRIDTKQYITNWYLPAGTGVYRKTFGKERLEHIRKQVLFDDNDIVMNSLFYGDMYYINRCNYAYRQEEGSVYSSMNQTERALLNICGIDSGTALMGQAWEKAFIERYHNAVLTTYYWRHVIHQSGNNEKIQYYIQNYLSNPENFSYRVLHFDELDKTGKKEIRQTIKALNQRYREESIKIRIKYMLRGLL